MTNGKTIALTRQTLVGKVMSLLLNMLSRLVITSLPRSKCPLISWLQSPSAVILEPPKMKSDTVKVKVKSLSCVRLFGTPWTVAYHAPQFMEFSRQEYWSGLPFPSPRDLPDPGIKPRSPTLQANSLPSEPQGKPHYPCEHSNNHSFDHLNKIDMILSHSYPLYTLLFFFFFFKF